ncbi:hypothetical protein [Mesorhizobium sp.]|jgi:hypothetical protein|uniref:hypothetical protein n=1 Tax=Mesorhizobium sp. TaxID=1871066 RepID=UPI000FE76749|nr:hypothetical protein [Mesorhizobium sp.]RWP63598.1 MAG: hypothetical protein EOR08_12265 [Mesorhizobium sp.]
MQHEREIDALLSSGEGSIIDRLMALPHPKDGARGANEWDRAVASRFETHLARQMRSHIDGKSDRQDAA